MTKEQTAQGEIGSYISGVFRKYFGKGPTSVYVTINRPFITIHFRGFLAPMERIQVKQKETKRVLETRDLMMTDLKPEIMQGLKEVAALEVKEMYADWNLIKETGMIIGVTEEDWEAGKWTDDAAEQAFKEAMEEASHKAEKVPGRTETYWLSDKVLLVRRSEILVQIEKELIKNGYVEELKLSKRPLEHRMLDEVPLEALLNRRISETFLDWNFDADLSYIVFLLEPKKA
ncbi:DUF2294 domain-containing protein [Planomicrobium sp. CPCC 101079]|uniref:DUF2294 domain-containing protein n=1 Tax=Planomicrobium sp. CPCC 101079 TaxID=2599618 RepID=UPI0011B71F20|nr:Na-translocating system protein MpsC family protein [Planomicrobium sp. CPCC 101079]TWT14306.1 DUF2294 family protein [Planomicrobium sp. CPCC 101079]